MEVLIFAANKLIKALEVNSEQNAGIHAAH